MSYFEQIIGLLESLKCFGGKKEYDNFKDEYHTLTCLPNHIYNNIIHDIINESPIEFIMSTSNVDHTVLYNADMIKNDVRLEMMDEPTLPLEFNASATNITFHTISALTISSYLQLLDDLDDRRRFITFNVSFTKNLNETIGHASVFVIDRHDKKNIKIYFFDPNGYTHTFDDVFEEYGKLNGIHFKQDRINSEYWIEQLLIKYANDCNELNDGRHYAFIQRNIWNPTRINLNRYINKYSIGAGNCVMTSALVMIHLSQFMDDITKFIDIYKNISNNEMESIVIGLSMNFYDQCCEKYNDQMKKNLEFVISQKNKHIDNNNINKDYSNNSNQDLLYSILESNQDINPELLQQLWIMCSETV